MRTIERRHYRIQRQEEDAGEEAVMIAHAEEPPEPWTCDPCGTQNNDSGRGNCLYCGKAR
jgi:hypothetical protein